ncbi:MAG TPA: hypothetical protein VIJ57_10135, partial [Hanamia sp.]
MANKNMYPSKGKWKVLRGNGTYYATINTNDKRLCEINIPDHINDKQSGLADMYEAQFNIQLFGAAKENYEALERIKKEILEALDKNIVQNEKVDFKLLVGKIADFADKALRNT